MTTATGIAEAPATGLGTSSSRRIPGLLWRRVVGWWPLLLLLLAVFLNPTPLGVGVWSTTDDGRTVLVTYGYRGDDLIYVVAESAAGATLRTAVKSTGSASRLSIYPGAPENCLAKAGGLYIREDSTRFEAHELHLSLNVLLEKLHSKAAWKDIIQFLRQNSQ